MKNLKHLVVLFFITILLAGCVLGSGHNDMEKKAGFFPGIWHGWIASASLIISIFDKKIRIYETNNTGFWDDFGYYIAVIGFGGLALFRKRRINKK
jgi:hypothetical protein